MTKQQASKEMRTKDKQAAIYRTRWEAKTLHQCKKELESWHKHMDKHSAGYHWADDSRDQLNDADRVLILKEIIRDKCKKKRT